MSATILLCADFNKRFFLEIDGSFHGLGAALSQEIGDRKRPIAYASRGLKGSEQNIKNYSSRKLELLTLRWAVTEKFKDYLAGSKFTVLTDNNPLTYLDKAKLGAVEQMWMSDLARFDFQIEYRARKANGNADGLSRKPHT